MFNESKYTKWYTRLMMSRKIRIHDDNYYEIHHIIPKALGGSDTSENTVYLSAREHFIAHWLLIKMVKEFPHKRSMQFAFWQMSRGGNKHQKRRITAAQYEIAKRHVAEANKNLNVGRKYKIDPETEAERRRKIGDAHRGKKVVITEETRKKLSEAAIGEKNSFYGRTHSLEFREAQSERFKGVPLSEERKAKLKESALRGDDHPKGMLGKSHSLDAKRKMSIASKGKPKTEHHISNMRKPKPKVTCPHCGKEGGVNNMKRYHFDRCSSTKEYATTP